MPELPVQPGQVVLRSEGKPVGLTPPSPKAKDESSRFSVVPTSKSVGPNEVKKVISAVQDATVDSDAAESLADQHIQTAAQKIDRFQKMRIKTK